MSDNPGKTVLKYREQLDKLEIKWTHDMDQAALKALLENAMKGSSQKADDEVHNEEAIAAAQAEAKSDADRRVAELERQLEEIKKLITGQSGGQQGLSADVVREIARISKNEVGEDGLVDPSFIAPEDEMEVAEVFYRHGPTHNIFHGMKAGVKVPLPYKMKVIKFEQSAGWVTRTGSGLQQRRISIFVTKNRKVSEFLKNYSEFGKTIHLDRERAFNSTVSGRYMELYNKHHAALQGQPMHILTQMAADLGIPTSMGMSHKEYSEQIAEVQALAAMKQDAVAFETQMRALGVDKELMKNPG